jgi:hypothetical protein
MRYYLGAQASCLLISLRRRVSKEGRQDACAPRVGCCAVFNFDTHHTSRYPSHVPLFARVAQWIERLPPEQEAAGSNPAAGITEIKGPPNSGPFSL